MQRLKSITFSALALAASAMCSAAQPGMTELQSESYVSGPLLTWEIPDARAASLRRWVPSQGNPPYPVDKAVKVATAWLKKRHPEVRQFAVSYVQLAPIAYGKPPADRWFYRIECDRVLDGKPVKGGTFIAVVLFDGSVVEPREERK